MDKSSTDFIVVEHFIFAGKLTILILFRNFASKNFIVSRETEEMLSKKNGGFWLN